MSLIKYEKFYNLMDRYKLDFKVIEDTIKKFNTVSLDIVGDTIVDTFTKCKNIGGQTKTLHCRY